MTYNPLKSKWLSESDKKRLWDKVTIGKSKKQCWEWNSRRDRDGYGRMRAAGKTFFAHKIAFAATKGDVPKNICVCHSCDNPPCCNPAHLWLGTNAENTRDRDLKNRTARGDNSGPRLHPEKLSRGSNHYARKNPERMLRGQEAGRAKLTNEQVIFIRASNESYSALGVKFGVSRTNIRRICARDIWKHLP